MNETATKFARRKTHGDLIRILLQQYGHVYRDPVLVETGCGVSTVTMAEMGKLLGAKVYSCDANEEKVRELQRRAGERLANVEFVLGDSLAGLSKILEQHPRLDFVFLDAAPSAMHTFREFQLIEPSLRPGSLLLIDNAALPNQQNMLSPCRKGKILVPYLLASSYWEVSSFPAAGDSMVSALLHDSPDYADPAYEWVGYVDPWKQDFAERLD